MEQLRQIGEVLGSLKVLMAFQDEIQINKRQCCMLVDAFNLAFESITEEVRRNLNFEERFTKWKALDHPLKELYRIFREGEQFVRQCMEVKDWWVKAISLGQNTDCVEFHLHNLLWCIPVVMEAIEIAGEFSGCDQDGIQKKRIIFSKKYEREWMEPKLFQHKFGGQHLVSQSICSRMDTVWKEDRWMLLDMICGKRSSMSKQENRLADLLEGSRGRIFPSSILVGSKDYQVRRRLGSGSHYKEIQWMGENFAVRHFFGSIDPLVPEISLLLSLAHPNVMNFLCAFSDDEKKECFLVMELMQKSLCNHIKETCGPKRKVPFPLPVAVDIMLQIARGMEYLHSHKIYHGNLNPSSILVKTRSSSSDGYLLAKIADIGLATVKNLRASSANQSATDPCIWYAPEVLQEQEQARDSCESKYTEKADVYSFGMICFELLTGKVPFEDGHLQGDKMSRNVRAGERPLFPFPSPKYLTSLTKRCWQTDPSQRPNFSSICRMLRYIKRFLILNPDHSQPDAPLPAIDYFDLETSLIRGFTSWATTESMHISQVPFQMYAYRVIERERTSVNVKDKSSESGSDGTSVCGDENVFSPNVSEEAFSVSLSSLKSAAQLTSEAKKKISLKKAANGKTNTESGQKQKSRVARPPQLSLCGRSMRMNSEGQLPAMKLGRRRSSGHASDSELA